jgi:hypothetical protein
MASNIDKNHDGDNKRRNPLYDSKISSTVSSLSEVTDIKTEDIKTEEDEQGGPVNQDEEEEEKFQINLELVRPEDEESEEEDRESTDEGIDEIGEEAYMEEEKEDVIGEKEKQTTENENKETM